MNETVAIIELGIMGGSIASNLKLRGRVVRGFDIDPAARRARPRTVSRSPMTSGPSWQDRR